MDLMDELVRFAAHLIQNCHVSKATAKRYVSFISKHKDHLTADFFIPYFQDLLDKEYHASSINSGMVNAVRAWGHFTNNEDLLCVKKLPVAKHEISRSILSVDEINQLINLPCKYCSEEQWEKWNLILRILSRTGLRPIELLRCKVSMLNLGLNTFDLPGCITKTKQARSVPIPRELRRTLIYHIKPLKADDYLFSTSNGKMIHRNKLTDHFTKRIKRIGIKRNVSLYSLRHAALTRCLHNSNILTTKALAGHSSLETTEGYIHLDTSNIAEAMDRDELVQGNMPIPEIFKLIINYVKGLVQKDKRLKVEVTETDDELVIRVKKKETN